MPSLAHCGRVRNRELSAASWPSWQLHGHRTDRERGLSRRGPPGRPEGGATDSGNGEGSRPDDGTEPDARFTFANERTFLAWNRTALALVVAGLGIVQLLPPFPGVPWGRHVLGIPLIALGAAVSVVAYREWRGAQQALRHGRPLPRSVLPRVLAATVAGVAVLSAVVLLISAVR